MRTISNSVDFKQGFLKGREDRRLELPIRLHSHLRYLGTGRIREYEEGYLKGYFSTDRDLRIKIAEAA